MFRAVKKRKPQRLLTARAKDDDDDDDDKDENDDQEKTTTATVVKPSALFGAAKSKSSSSRRRPRTFVVAQSLLPVDGEEVDDDDDDEENSKTKKNKRFKKRGMGFGGGSLFFSSPNDDDQGNRRGGHEHEEDHDDEAVVGMSSVATSRYDKSALEKLKSEQRFKTRRDANNVQQQQQQQYETEEQPQQQTSTDAEMTAATRENHDDVPPLNQNNNTSGWRDNNQHNIMGSLEPPPAAPAPLSKPLPDFISLNDATKNGSFAGNVDDSMVVLAGDDAAMYEDELLEKAILEAAKINALSTNKIKGRRHQQDGEDDDDIEEGEESSAWENQILRRAGLAVPTNTTTSTSTSNYYSQQQQQQQQKPPTSAAAVPTPVSASTNTTSTPSSTTTTKLRNQIQSTLTQLATQQEDLHRALERRQWDLQQAQTELQRHSLDLQQAGQALEYYQQLRERLASWVGALRELQTKLRPLRDARLELERDRSGTTTTTNSRGSHWMEWENDMVAVLQQAQLLEQVLGRQPKVEAVVYDIVTVDEFGRDVKSQQVLQREQRYRHRRHVMEQRQRRRQQHDETGRKEVKLVDNKDDVNDDDDDDSDAFASDGEMQSLDERRRALDLAFHVALEEMEDEYTNMDSLVAIFQEWSETYNDDYRNCFANLSLADLAGVLVEKYLSCEDQHPLHWLDHGPTMTTTAVNDDDDDDAAGGAAVASSAFTWLDALRLPEKSSENSEEHPMHLVLERVVIPRVLELLDQSIYSLLSSKQSKSLSAMYGWLVTRLPPNGAAITKTTDRMVQYICQEIQNVSVPILKADTWTTTTTIISMVVVSEEVQDAIRSATCGQVRRIIKLLRNVLIYWAPHLSDSQRLTEAVLEFCSTKLLFLLSSLQAAFFSESSAAAKQQFLNVATLPSPPESFAQVYSALRTTKWLDKPENMLQGASIRAAAIAYGISTN